MGLADSFVFWSFDIFVFFFVFFGRVEFVGEGGRYLPRSPNPNSSAASSHEMDPEATRTVCVTWYQEEESCGMDHNKPDQLSSGKRENGVHRNTSDRPSSIKDTPPANSAWQKGKHRVGGCSGSATSDEQLPNTRPPPLTSNRRGRK